MCCTEQKRHLLNSRCVLDLINSLFCVCCIWIFCKIYQKRNIMYSRVNYFNYASNHASKVLFQRFSFANFAKKYKFAYAIDAILLPQAIFCCLAKSVQWNLNLLAIFFAVLSILFLSWIHQKTKRLFGAIWVQLFPNRANINLNFNEG